MKNFYLIVKESGGYLKDGSIEYRIRKDCNGFNVLEMRFLNKGHSDEPNEGWSSIYVSGN